jgi:serine/threonine-protein kinase
MLRDLEEFRRSPDMVFDYSYFVDDQPTKFVDAVNAPVVTPNANLGDEEEYEDDYYDDAEEEKSPVIPILTGIAIAFVVAAIAIGIILWKFVLNADNGESIIVPNFVGKTYTELQENSQYSDYNFVVELKSSETHEAGKVISQDPKDGRKIRKTQKITIVVSKGPDLQEIPKVDNLDLTTAKQVLKSAGFTWEVKYQTHNEIVSGNVITTNPEYGGKVAYGSKIDIYVSLGPEIIYVNYKSFSGYDLETAKKKIEEFGLTVGDITYKDSSTPKNIVIGQTPDVSTNTTIAKGTAVNLVVSSGEISYQTKLVIKDLPKNFKDEYKMMKMSVFVGGIKVFETDSEFNANDLENPWSIDISSKNQTTKAVINLEFVGGESPVKLEGALEYTVDFVNNSIMPTKNKIDDTYLDDSLVDNEQENQNPEGNN